jgi:hypothetical protein
MTDGKGHSARARRQERVAKVVWGTLLLVMGVLFTLHDMGRIDLSGGGGAAQAFAAGNAVDGDPQTRWASSFSDRQWLAVDLGAVRPLRRIGIHWEDAFAREYQLAVSNDGLTWTTVRSVTNGDGGLDEHEVDATGRYVRLTGITRSTRYGFSVWELQVFDASGALVSQGMRATASSLEGRGAFAHWLRFWPLLMVAAGLPLVLAPRDDTNQVMGVVLTALGTFWQLQRLEVVPWGFRETASLLLIVIGLLILLQSLRRPEAPDPGGPGAGGDAR